MCIATNLYCIFLNSYYSTIGMEEFRKMLPWPHQVKTTAVSHSTPAAPVEQAEQVC